MNTAIQTAPAELTHCTTAARRLVRFTAVSVDDLALEEDRRDLIVLDTFVDETGRIVNNREMFGYEKIHVGEVGTLKFSLLRLQPDLTVLFEETATTFPGCKTGRVSHPAAVSETIRVSPGREFEFYVDDVYAYRIVNVLDLQTGHEEVATPSPLTEKDAGRPDANV